MSSDREHINNYEREMAIESSLIFHQKVDEYPSSVNFNMSRFQSYARGNGVKMYFARVRCPTNSSSLIYKYVQNSNTLHERISSPPIISPKQESSAQRGIQSISNSNGEGASLVVQMNEQQSNNEEFLLHNRNENVLLPALSRDSRINLINNQRFICRLDIQNEIGNMIEGVLALNEDGDKEYLYIADCYCHLDILFEKLKKSKQTIYQYLEYNSSIYNKGIDMIYIIQSFFAPHHIKYENWTNEYKNYLDHPCVYGTCGISPLFAHHFDMKMELNLRRTLNHPKVVAVGEIGLDFETQSRPDEYVQVALFIKQLHIAKEKNLPVVLISKNSFVQTLQCLSDCPHVWNTHPIFAIQVYRLISHLFQMPIRKTVDKLVDNMIYFYHLK
ncbi:hypothetical protein I4U23_005699 [Adineta vaga]|nr:hypothetical protein I4U23_005699 [Adineta vaga]